MKRTLHISAIFDKPELVQQLVEQLAYRRNAPEPFDGTLPDGLAGIETSSTESFVSGTLVIDVPSADGTVNEQINMPFITCFAFTCIKGKTQPYQLIWSASLN